MPHSATSATALRDLRVAFAGGGTGGHIVPGIHLLDQARDKGVELKDVLWFVTGRAVERAALGRPFDGAPAPTLFPLPVEPPAGGAPSYWRLGAKLPGAAWKAREALKAHGTQVVLGLGGYTTVPVVLAARSLGLPVALLEINAVPGRATRGLWRMSARVLHAFEATAATFPGARSRVVGAPLATNFKPPQDPLGGPMLARANLGFDPKRPLLVVLGGSQGARGINTFMRTNAAPLTGRGIQILHQVGPGRLAEGATPSSGYRPVEYIDEVSEVLTAADLVLCRGGASTLAEVAAVGTPVWVVPYPHHKDLHQAQNARHWGRGMRIVPESELDATRCAELADLVGPEGIGERTRMREVLLAHPRKDSAGAIWTELCDLASGA